MERRPYEDYDFSRHFEGEYAGSGTDYKEMEPAYRYGYLLAGEQDDEWDEIEEDARTRWETDYPEQDWDTCVVAVRYGYNRSRAGDTFRQHFDDSYAGTGKAWAHSAPAYDYGYEFAQREDYLDRPWEEVEDEARKGWVQGYAQEEQLEWDDIRELMAYGYERGQFDYAGTGKGWVTGYSES